MSLIIDFDDIVNDPKLQTLIPTFLKEVNGDMMALSVLPAFLTAFHATVERQKKERKEAEAAMDAFEEDLDDEEALDDEDGHEPDGMIGCTNHSAHDFIACPYAHSGEQIAICSSFMAASGSSAAGGGGGGGGAAEVKPKSKTPCSFFAKGSCTKGESCLFSHSLPAGGGGAAAVTITKSKTICSFFVKGICTKGDSCRFSHQLPAGGGQ